MTNVLKNPDLDPLCGTLLNAILMMCDGVEAAAERLEVSKPEVKDAIMATLNEAIGQIELYVNDGTFHDPSREIPEG